MLGPSTSGKLHRTSGFVNDAASPGSPRRLAFAEAPETATEPVEAGAVLCAFVPESLVQAATRTNAATPNLRVQRMRARSYL